MMYDVRCMMYDVRCMISSSLSTFNFGKVFRQKGMKIIDHTSSIKDF